MGDVLKKRKVSVIKILTLEKVKCKQRNNYENTRVERDPRDHKAKKPVTYYTNHELPATE